MRWHQSPRGLTPHRWSALGFTLVEVMVALVIVALGVGALLTTLTSAADNAVYFRDKSFAQWIALNRLSETRLQVSKPAVGETDGEVEFANQRWRWQQTVSDQGMAGILRIEVRVFRLDETASAGAALTSAYGFTGQALGRASGIDPDWSSSGFAGPNQPGGPVNSPLEVPEQQ